VTPTYKGSGQPPADSGGVLGTFGSFFGSQTPAYRSVGQSTPAGSSGSGSNTPAYAVAPTAVRRSVMCPIDPSGCPIDPAALAAGQIAIVVPRQALVDGSQPCPIDPSPSPCPIDPAALAAGQIVIVIPQQALLESCRS
jgi:hypothetical protein